MRILAVEDDQLVRNLVIHQLASLGYDVTGAASGAEALRILEEDSDFDLLFTDLVMPGGIMGTDLAEKAREINSGLRILFTSGYSDDLLQDNDKFALEAAQLVRKPYRKAELAEKISEALKR